MNPFEQRLREKSDPFAKRANELQEFEGQYQTPEETERETERAQAQFTSRALEGVAGLPGDLVNFAAGLFGYEPNLPGSQKLREFSEDITGGYTKPQTELEEKVGDTVQDIALFAMPGAKHYSIARNIGIPIVSNLIKEGINYAGGDEKKQAYGKIGSMVLLDLLSHRSSLGNAKNYASSLFQKAEAAVPEGVSINAGNLKSGLNELEASLRRGGSRPDTAEALTKISEINDIVDKKGFVNLKDLLAFRPAINAWIDKFKGFEIGSSPKIRRQIVNNLNQVKGEVIKAAEQYGEKHNPEFLKLSRSANEAYAAVESSNKISNFIQKHARNKLQSSGAHLLLGLTPSVGTALSPAIVGPLAAGAASGYKLLKTILRSKSPTLRQHYFNILSGAAKGDSAAVIKNLKSFDNELKDLDETGEIQEFLE